MSKINWKKYLLKKCQNCEKEKIVLSSGRAGAHLCPECDAQPIAMMKATGKI